MAEKTELSCGGCSTTRPEKLRTVEGAGIFCTNCIGESQPECETCNEPATHECEECGTLLCGECLCESCDVEEEDEEG